MKFTVQVCVAAAAVASLLPEFVTGALIAAPGAHHGHHHHHHPRGGQVRGSAQKDQPKSADEKHVQTPVEATHVEEKHVELQAYTSPPPPTAPVDPVHKEIRQEVESMEQKISEIHDVKDATEFAGRLAEMEVELSKTGEKAEAIELMDRMNMVRINLCSNHHLMSSEIQDCDTFMQRTCHPDAQKHSQVPPVQCHQFFLHAKTRVHGEVAEPAPAPAPAPAPFGAAAPAASPGSAGVDERGYTAAQKAEALRIWTQGGKLEGPLPSQGFSGEKVDHNYMHTMTEDWQAEFGPAADHKGFTQVCAEHPDNEWCRLHGYYPKDKPIDEPWYDQYGILHGHGKRNDGASLLIGLMVALAAAGM